MSHDEEFIAGIGDLPSATEPQGFKPAEMVRCDACLRANPPTRTNCLYCLAVLPVPDGTIDLRRPALRPLEEWEQGYNNVLARPAESGLKEKSLEAIATLLRLEPGAVKQIFGRGEALPLARAASFEEATLIGNRLRELGVEAVIISDSDLGMGSLPPKRIRTLELEADLLRGREALGDTSLSIPWSDTFLMVAGRLLVTRVEIEENKFRSGERELIDARELTDDEPVVDIFTSRKDGGWRIAARSFDFSCLGDRKQLLATENFALLLELLRRRAPAAAFDDSYLSLGKLLTAVWPMMQQTEGRGWRRARPGKYNVAAVTTTNNENQFTRYSRLRHYLKLRDT